MEIACAGLVATKLNQTSSLMPAAAQVGAGSVLGVAFAVELAVVIAQLMSGFTVSGIAPEHSSFAGGGGGVPTQILKSERVLLADDHVHTRTKYICPAVSPPTMVDSGSEHAIGTSDPQFPE